MGTAEERSHTRRDLMPARRFGEHVSVGPGAAAYDRTVLVLKEDALTVARLRIVLKHVAVDRRVGLNTRAAFSQRVLRAQVTTTSTAVSVTRPTDDDDP